MKVLSGSTRRSAPILPARKLLNRRPPRDCPAYRSALLASVGLCPCCAN